MVKAVKGLVEVMEREQRMSGFDNVMELSFCFCIIASQLQREWFPLTDMP